MRVDLGRIGTSILLRGGSGGASLDENRWRNGGPTKLHFALRISSMQQK